MPATKCAICDHAHRRAPRRNPMKHCVVHDPNNYVDPRLAALRGLPDDCPGCLGSGTIEKKPYGKRAGDFTLTCRTCRQVYQWSSYAK